MEITNFGVKPLWNLVPIPVDFFIDPLGIPISSTLLLLVLMGGMWVGGEYRKIVQEKLSFPWVLQVFGR